MVSIEAGAKKEKEVFAKGMDVVQIQETGLQAFVAHIKEHIKNVELSSIAKRETVCRIFNDLRAKIADRERALNKQIADVLESEHILLRQKLDQIKD
mmetsp:Transcript_33048/g.50663  ORF Transcript_33048/g.50663 Transcript_33048/m.50663 type:complete len:97 (+) Transcript_33048:709-999(+)